MISSTPNTGQATSPKPPAEESKAMENESNRSFANEMVKAAVEGLNRLAREKPSHAA